MFDIDGTVTSSDVRGVLGGYGLIGGWIQPDVGQLWDKINYVGAEVIFMTMRSIEMVILLFFSIQV